jgi:glycosidase
MNGMSKHVIYQLFVRLFGNKSVSPVENGTRHENGCGKFSDINKKALNALKTLGVSHIWYTGVIEHAVAADYSRFGIETDFPEIIKGRAGSPYAIKDYYDVNPDLAENVARRMDEFEDLVQRTHDAGMKVIIDFVPNHLARLYRSDAKHHKGNDDFGAKDQPALSFSPENDFYYLPGEELILPTELYRKAAKIEYRDNPMPYSEKPARATGNDCFSASPGENDWYETVKLNYGVDFLNGKQLYFQMVPPVWEKMKAIVLFWAGKKIDGFRVDMAEMVPLEFWEWLIPSIKEAYPDIVFIAEIYQPHLYNGFIERGRFDYLYDKIDFYEAVRNIIENKSDTGAITGCWQRIGNLEKHMLRFLENHDEQRIASRFFADDPWKALPGMVLAATMNSGPVLIYFGQDAGEPARGCSGFSGDDGRTTIFDYWNVPNHQKWMNNGEFDGMLLSEDLKKLRENYRLILNLCKDKPLFSNGYFYDLMWVNRDISDRSSGKIYAYLRYQGNNICLLILNFGDNNFSGLSLFIPDDAIRAMSIDDHLKLIEKHVFPNFKQLAVSRLKNSRIDFDIPAFSAVVLFFENNSLNN